MITTHISIRLIFPWSGQKKISTSRGPTVVKCDFINSKLRERHFLTKNLMNNYQITTSTRLSSLPLLKLMHTSTVLSIKPNRYRQLLTSRYVLPLGILKTISTVCNFTVSLSIAGNIKVLQEQLFFSHVHNLLNLTTSSRTVRCRFGQVTVSLTTQL